METKISIHALRKESDDRENSARFFDISFQSTLSVRRATSMDGATVRNS